MVYGSVYKMGFTTTHTNKAPFNDVDLKGMFPPSMYRQITDTKRKLIKLGFEHQLAMYGVLTNKETEESKYKRIDVLIDTPITLEIFTRIYDFINFIKSPAHYSIWAYSDETKQLKEVIFFE